MHYAIESEHHDFTNEFMKLEDEGGKYDLSYPLLAEKQLGEMLEARYDKTAYAMRIMVENHYGIVNGDLMKTTLTTGRVLANMNKGVFLKFQWLALFHNENDFVAENTGKIPSLEAAILYYGEQVQKLLDTLNAFLPVKNEGILMEICRYILFHPEEELKLKTLADRFYLNHTYLSNLFRQKTGAHFNDYLTMVKMARAKYLIKNEPVKVYEISMRLGYRDNDYFSKLFKLKCGISPAEFRKKWVSA